MDPIKTKYDAWRGDWCLFAREVLQVNLDPEQEEILRSVQVNPRTSVVSGTSRGKDYIAAVAAVCFFYLTPVWDPKTGFMTQNTKVALTAPTGRQIEQIMYPEIVRIVNNSFGGPLYGRLVGNGIKTDFKEWFLTGFRSDESNHEAWSGFHAANTMFVVTEASGIGESVFEAIEGNLQGNSRILLVFNGNRSNGYAAQTQRSKRWAHFRLSSLTAPNVKAKKIIHSGQVDFAWIKDKVELWCQPIQERDILAEEGDFNFEGRWYRPNDLFRVKILGLFPKSSSDTLVPEAWIELAVERWHDFKERGESVRDPLRLGVDVAGMGRDSSCLAPRYGNFVDELEMINSGGTANHMELVGLVNLRLANKRDEISGVYPQAFIDTIGEGAGVYSRLIELAHHEPRDFRAQLKNHTIEEIHSVKAGEGTVWDGERLTDSLTGEYTFRNMRSYLAWAVRDWLNPASKTGAMLPPDDDLKAQLMEIVWRLRSDGSIELEPKKELIKRLRKSPDQYDALANTFYPVPDIKVTPRERSAASFFGL